MGNARSHRESSPGVGLRHGGKRLCLNSSFHAPNAGSTSPATTSGQGIRSNARPAPRPSPCPRLLRLRPNSFTPDFLLALLKFFLLKGLKTCLHVNIFLKNRLARA